MLSFAQDRKISYYGLPSDTTLASHLLTVLTDSTIEVSSMPHHLSQQYQKTLSYSIHQSELVVLGDISENIPTQYSFVSKGFKLIRKGDALLDTSSKTVYVPVNQFQTYNLLYIIDGKHYLQKMGQTDGYGIIKKQFKQNSSLEHALKNLEPTIETHSVNVYKGFEAYQRYGYKYVFGVIEICKKF